MSIIERAGELIKRVQRTPQELKTDSEIFPITPGDYVVITPTDPAFINVVLVYGEEFESGSCAHLSAGDSFTVVSAELAKIFYSKAPWWIAGTSGKPARPRDGSWPAVAVEVEKDGEIIQGLIPVDSFDRIAPRV
jgi:hypothetical protein